MLAPRRTGLRSVPGCARLGRFALAAFAAAAALHSIGVQADAIGPEPPPVACPAGGVSAIENWMRHGQRAYCAPYLSPRTGPLAGACREGYRAEVLELSISGITPSIGGHYGGPPIVPTDDNTLARLDGPCDAPDEEPEISMDLEHESARGGFGGPSVAEAPVGCHRFWVWVTDRSVHCPVEVGAAAPEPIGPSAAVVVVPEPAAALEAASPRAIAEAAPVAPFSTTEPPPTEPPAAESRSPPASSGSSCACSAVGASTRADASLLITCVSALAALRQFRVRRGTKGIGWMKKAGIEALRGSARLSVRG